MTTATVKPRIGHQLLRRKPSSLKQHGAFGLLAAFILLVLRSIWAAFVVAAMRTPKEMHRFLLGWVASVTLIWLVVAGYIFLAKPTFTSKWTLILPTATSGVSLQLESIGHAQTIPSSPFGSSSLSPKAVYKEIIGSEAVRLSAARKLGMELQEFGAARVKLIDETALMMLEIGGRTPEQSQMKAKALLDSLHQQLDVLRQDEIRQRAEVVEKSLKSYQANLQSARNLILDHQQRTGMLSINQFNEASTSHQLMLRRLMEVRGEISRLDTERNLLSSQLGIDVATAGPLLRLSADPSFARLAGEYADSRASLGREEGRMGHANPLLSVLRGRAEAMGAELRRLAQSAGVSAGASIDNALLVLNGTHRSELVKSLLATSALISGRKQELTTLEAEYARLGEDVRRMSGAVARLEDLKKDHLVAEAVFTSALARLDTNKVDMFASYPMVQTLSAPDLPDAKTSPRTLIALLGGVAATLLALGGWGMGWLRHAFVRRR